MMMSMVVLHQARQQCGKRGGNSTTSWRKRDGGAMREEAMQQPTSTREENVAREVAIQQPASARETVAQ